MSIVTSPVTGSVWKLEVAVGDAVAAGDEVAILESMKMEIPAEAEADGVVAELLVAGGDAVADGDPLIRIDP